MELPYRYFMADITTIEAKFQALSNRLDEAALRVWAAAEARSLGRGGVTAVAKAIGMSRTTIHAGLSELKATALPVSKSNTRPRVRSVGGGRKKLADKDASLLVALDRLVKAARLHAVNGREVRIQNHPLFAQIAD